MEEKRKCVYNKKGKCTVGDKDCELKFWFRCFTEGEEKRGQKRITAIF